MVHLGERDVPVMYTVTDLIRLRDSTMLGSTVEVRDETNGYVRVVVMAKYAHILLTSGGCYTWTDVLLNKGKKVSKE